MRTYNIIEKNGNAVIIFSAEEDETVDDFIKEHLKFPDAWYIECIDEKEE